MHNLDTDRPLLLWGAERPFQLQLLAGLLRLGLDVLALEETSEGKTLIDRIHPKNKEGLQVLEDFEGLLLWAPSKELFFNAALSENSLLDFKKLLGQKKASTQKIVALLPQIAFGQIEADHEIYFPALVGFGDENVFDKNLDLTLRSGITGDEIPTELLSIFDAVSFVLSAVKSKELPNRLWIQGSKIEKTSLEKGFKEITNQGALLNAIAPLSYYYQKMSGKIPQFKIHSVSKVPSQVILANDFFPTTLSTWERFLRDSYRIYKTTPDSEILLHFRPTKSP